MSTKIHSSFDECNQQSTIGIKITILKVSVKSMRKKYVSYIYLYLLFTILYNKKKNQIHIDL